MRTTFAVIAAISAVALPGLGHAAADLSKMTPGYTYYNMPGTTLADHDVEVGACAAEAVKVQSFGAQANKHMGGLLVDAMGDAANRGAFAAKPPRPPVSICRQRSDAGFVVQFTDYSLDLVRNVLRRQFSQHPQPLPRPKLDASFGVGYSQRLFQMVLRFVCFVGA